MRIIKEEAVGEPVLGQHLAVGMVLLTAQNADTLTGAVMTSSSPDVSTSVQMVQPLPTGDGTGALPDGKMLEVAISPKAPLRRRH